MKILVLLALLTLIPCTQCLAQTPQAPSAATPAALSMTTAAAPANVAAFLATLSGDPGNGPIAETFCTTNADCPTGQICCYPCGIDGCDKACTTPWRGNRCPPIP